MIGLILSVVMSVLVSRASAQWTVTFVPDNQQAAAVLGQGRVGPMNDALDRAKAKLEQILGASTGSALIEVRWTAPSATLAVAESIASQNHITTATVARDKLISQSSADNEPQSEIALYEALPNVSVPLRYETDAQLSANFVGIPNSLNKHLQFQPTTNQNDGVMKFRPPDATTKWQFWEKSGGQLSGHEVFEAVAFHETMHLLGFASAGTAQNTPSALFTWDLFRAADSAVPVSSTAFTGLVRELRPTQEATAITAFNSTTNAYPLSRGNRPGTGGDGFQASHWRALSRLTPPQAIGVMDPSASGAVHTSLMGRVFTRPDGEALDVMGWNVNPNSVQYSNAGSIDLQLPIALAHVAAGASIIFSWGPTSFLHLSLCIYPGTEIIDDNPVRVFYRMPGDTTSVTLQAADALPPGEYVWTVVGSTQTGSRGSEDRRLTIVGGCDSIDFNQDGLFPDVIDVDDFLGVIAGGVCPSTGTVCNSDIDFNNDGLFPDTLDVDSFVSVFAGGPCL